MHSGDLVSTLYRSLRLCKVQGGSGCSTVMRVDAAKPSSSRQSIRQVTWRLKRSLNNQLGEAAMSLDCMPWKSAGMSKAYKEVEAVGGVSVPGLRCCYVCKVCELAELAHPICDTLYTSQMALRQRVRGLDKVKPQSQWGATHHFLDTCMILSGL
jgi:hypothetical protein